MRYKLRLMLGILLLTAPAGLQAQGIGMGGGMSLGNSGARTSSFGSTSGMFGQRSLGGTLQAGQRTFASGNLLDQTMAGAGQLTGSERFVRGNRQAGNFVGADASDVQALMRNIPGYSQGTGLTGTNLQSMRSRSGQQRRPGLQASSSQQQVSLGTRPGTNIPPIRSHLNVEFEHPPLVSPTRSTALTERLNSPRIKSLTPLEVEIQGRTAVLRGEVATVHDRTLAEQVARLEPGISEVRNELKVSGLPTLSAPALLPTQTQPPVSPSDSSPAPVPDAK